MSLATYKTNALKHCSHLIAVGVCTFHIPSLSNTWIFVSFFFVFMLTTKHLKLFPITSLFVTAYLYALKTTFIPIVYNGQCFWYLFIRFGFTKNCQISNGWSVFFFCLSVCKLWTNVKRKRWRKTTFNNICIHTALN